MILLPGETWQFQNSDDGLVVVGVGEEWEERSIIHPFQPSAPTKPPLACNNVSVDFKLTLS